MRSSGWMLAGVVLAAVPLAVGIATGQTWTPYVTYALWGVVILAGILRQVIPRRRPSVTNSAVVSAGDVYNELYLGRQRTEVTFGDSDVVAEGTAPTHDQIVDGKITLDLRPRED
jgi:hypothetical protein